MGQPVSKPVDFETGVPFAHDEFGAGSSSSSSSSSPPLAPPPRSVSGTGCDEDRSMTGSKAMTGERETSFLSSSFSPPPPAALHVQSSFSSYAVLPNVSASSRSLAAGNDGAKISSDWTSRSASSLSSSHSATVSVVPSSPPAATATDSNGSRGGRGGGCGCGGDKDSRDDGNDREDEDAEEALRCALEAQNVWLIQHRIGRKSCRVGALPSVHSDPAGLESATASASASVTAATAETDASLKDERNEGNRARHHPPDARHLAVRLLRGVRGAGIGCDGAASAPGSIEGDDRCHWSRRPWRRGGQSDGNDDGAEAASASHRQAAPSAALALASVGCPIPLEELTKLRGEAGLRLAGFEYRTVPCEKHRRRRRPPCRQSQSPSWKQTSKRDGNAECHTPLPMSETVDRQVVLKRKVNGEHGKQKWDEVEGTCESAEAGLGTNESTGEGESTLGDGINDGGFGVDSDPDIVKKKGGVDDKFSNGGSGGGSVSDPNNGGEKRGVRGICESDESASNSAHPANVNDVESSSNDQGFRRSSGAYADRDRHESGASLMTVDCDDDNDANDEDVFYGCTGSRVDTDDNDISIDKGGEGVGQRPTRKIDIHPPYPSFCPECVTRLHHIATSTAINHENRARYIADGDMYDEIARLCQDYAQDLMIAEGGLEWVTVCDDRTRGEPVRALVDRNHIFPDGPLRLAQRGAAVLEEEAAPLPLPRPEDSESRLGGRNDKPRVRPTLLVVTGKGKVRAGVFSRSHLINSGIEPATALPMVREARRRGMGVVLLDPNARGYRKAMETFEVSVDAIFGSGRRQGGDLDVGLSSARDESKEDEQEAEREAAFGESSLLRGCDSHHRHHNPMCILAYSASGGQLVRYLMDAANPFLSRIRAIAFTDSTHNVQWTRNDPRLSSLLESPCCVYVRSADARRDGPHSHGHKAGEEVRTDPHWRRRFGSVRTVWAGTAVHELANWAAHVHIWEHFDRHFGNSGGLGNDGSSGGANGTHDWSRRDCVDLSGGDGSDCAASESDRQDGRPFRSRDFGAITV